MKNFQCCCGQRLFFENTQCTGCGRTVGLDTQRLTLVALEPEDDRRWAGVAVGGGVYRLCENFQVHGVCN